MQKGYAMYKTRDENRDRRRHERKPCNLDVDLDDYQHVCRGMVRNMGKGGAFIEADLEVRPHIGQEIYMTIPYQQQRNYLIIKAKVAWIAESGLGVSFKGWYQ